MKALNIRVFLFLLFLILPLQYSQSEDTIYEISNELMCPVCQGQTVAESNSQLAISMKEVIKIKRAEGKSKEEILEYFVDQYGDTILAKPPLKGFGLILWITPPLILVISILFWILRIRRNRKNAS
jgi:cytochrome c-type biogenesis protein CcmH